MIRHLDTPYELQDLPAGVVEKICEALRGWFRRAKPPLLIRKSGTGMLQSLNHRPCGNGL